MAHYTSPDQLWHEISAWGRLILPASYTNSERFRRECSTLLLAAQRAAAGGTDTYRGREVIPVYTYRANTLIEQLQITPDEERHMTRLISDGEKYRREMERRRAAGVQERKAWLAEHRLSQDQPWRAEGVSRATWYRRAGS